MTGYIHLALLRGINVAGKNLIRMEEIRMMMCTELQCSNVRTYIQSGNIVFSSMTAQSQLESLIEAGISASLSLTVPVMVRSAEQWTQSLAACPFPVEASSDPSRLFLLTSKAPLPAALADDLQSRARDGEVVKLSQDSLWIYYPNGMAESKLTPSIIDRLAGAPCTARNWKTASALLDMLKHDNSR
jgi:uncharacterized protein (DUF1697 family)